MKNTLKILLICFITTFLVQSCKKAEDLLPEKPNTQSIDDNSDAQSEFDDVFSIAEDVMNKFKDQMDKSPQGTFGTLSDTTCANLSIDTAYGIAGVKGRISIDFGSTNCTGVDGKARRGIIYVTYTGKYRTNGTIITTTFEDYYVNDNKVEGTKIVTRVNDTLQTVNVLAAKISWVDGTTTLWESNKTRRLIEGKSTLFNFFDDVYQIDGTSSGTNRLEEEFTGVITEVTVKIDCWLSNIFYPVKGNISILPKGSNNPLVLDYGDGICDKKIKIIYNGITYDHELK